MAYGTGYEFPGVYGGYPDVCELIYLYKKLTEQYGELLKTIQDTQQQLTDYMNQIQTLIPGWISAEVDRYVAEVEEMKQQVTKELENNQRMMLEFLKEYNEKVTLQLDNQNNKVTAQLEQNVEWVRAQLVASEQHTQLMIDRFTVQYKDAFKAQNANVKEQLRVQNEQIKEQLKQQDDKFELWSSMVEHNMDYIYKLLLAHDNQIRALNDELLKALDDFRKQLEGYNTVMRLWYYEHRYEDKKWLQEEIDKVNEQLENLPESKLPVFSLMRNRQVGIDQWTKDVQEILWPIGGYTAREWTRATWLSAEEFNASNITAIEFYVDGKRLLDDDRNKYYCFSPISGQYVWIGRALQEVANALNPDGVKAENYDAYKVKASTYDGKNVTANEYRKGRY